MQTARLKLQLTVATAQRLLHSLRVLHSTKGIVQFPLLHHWAELSVTTNFIVLIKKSSTEFSSGLDMDIIMLLSFSALSSNMLLKTINREENTMNQKSLILNRDYTLSEKWLKWKVMAN